MYEISQYNSELNSLCESLQVSRLYVFGSVLADSFDPNSSDLDFLVEIHNSNPLEKGEQLLKLWESLERIFKRKVDLLTPESIKNPVLLKQINSTKKLVYDRNSEKISG